MSETRSGGRTLRLTAVYTQGKLLLAAAGLRASPLDRVFFEPESPFGDPPSFALRGSSTATGDCGNRYQLAMLFAIGSPPDEVIVHCDGTEQRVPVLVAADPEALDRREPVRLVRMAASAASAAGAGLPAHFMEVLERDGEPVPAPILWPIRLGPLFDGSLERAPAHPRRATGYSENFDVGEAVRDAIRSLPREVADDGETLSIVTVTEVGALLGGLGGFERMFVSVLAY